MNERSKKLMEKQQQATYDKLKETFNLPVAEDEMNEDELPDDFNYFYIIYGNFQNAGKTGVLKQEIYIAYVSENNPNVETTSLDIITVIDKIPGIVFERTTKERYQKKDSDYYVDQVTFIFSRLISYEQD